MTVSPPPPDMPAARVKKGFDNTRQTFIRVLLFIAALLLITLGSVPPRPSPERLLNEEVGEPASRTVLAPFPLKIIDQQETDRVRTEAREKVPPTYARRTEAFVSRSRAPVLLTWVSGTPRGTSPFGAVIKPSRSRVHFVGLFDFTGERDPQAIADRLRAELARASGWPLDDQPVPTARKRVRDPFGV